MCKSASISDENFVQMLIYIYDVTINLIRVGKAHTLTTPLPLKHQKKKLFIKIKIKKR